MEFRRMTVAAVLALGFFLSAPSVFAVTGFVDTPMWVSPNKPHEGDSVTLSAVFRNAEQETISGTILFYDANTLIDEKPVTLRPDEASIVTTTFTITAGGHLFSATTKNLSQVSSTGKLEVLAVPPATIKLPLSFVPKTIMVAGQAGGASGDSTAVILNQIDKAQTAVLNVVSPTTKKKISTTASSIDTWRADNGASFAKSKNEAKTAIDAKKSGTTKTAKTTSKNQKVQSASVTAGPLTYVKYAFFWLLSVLFSSALVFYVFILLLLYFLLRYLFRKLRGGKKKAPVE